MVIYLKDGSWKGWRAVLTNSNAKIVAALEDVITSGPSQT